MTTQLPPAALSTSDETARAVARVLLEAGAVVINVANPFTYASGAKSPVYCDNRLLISYPDKRRIVVDAMVTVVAQAIGVDRFEAVAGVATGGIPWAAWLAEALGKPMLYVRDAPKGHGKGQRVEGLLVAGSPVVVVEDLVTTGRSLLSGVEGVREAGGVVDQCVSIFTYEWGQAQAAFQAAGAKLHPLSRIAVLLDVAVETGAISHDDLQAVQAWVSEHR
ncbi:MAG: orotate phosphoribosyltransferase [Dehalococcoidia bacterium]|nr:orotate phosphoribosyltransferase [Dehalococcoidia bacterium]